MEFFDCSLSYGIPRLASYFKPVCKVKDLLEKMKKTGVKKGVVWREEQLLLPPNDGNDLVWNDIKPYENLYALWMITPVQTGEICLPSEMLKRMKTARIAGWKLCPDKAGYPAHPLYVKEWLEAAEKYHVPVFMDINENITLTEAVNIFERFPKLTAVVSLHGRNPSNRQLYPLVAAFPNIHVNLAYLIWDQSIEHFVEQFYASRLIFGSGYPYDYMGSNMLMLQHAKISNEDKGLIASGNMERLIGGIVYDK